MPKPRLRADFAALSGDVIDTMLAGLKEWRADLSYPESHSDMQGCVRALLRMYEVKRRPIALENLPLDCDLCQGSGTALATVEGNARELRRVECPRGCGK